MGLDMWIFGIKDVSNENIPDEMDSSCYEDNGYQVIDICTSYEEELRDLLPYSVTKNVKSMLINMDKLKKDYNIPQEASVWLWGSDGVIGFQCGEDYNKQITVSDGEMEKYYEQVLLQSLIFKCDELAYWRKYYDLQDLIHNEYCGEIYNCGYHKLDNELLKTINKFLEKNKQDTQSINDDGYVAKMYHEWY